MKEAIVKAMSHAGKDIRLTLKKHYGSPEAAEEAIRERMVDIAELEKWATYVLRKDYHENWRPSMSTPGSFSFDEIPEDLREKAIESMAAAMAAWEVNQ